MSSAGFNPKLFFQTLGILSPYIAVLGGVFLLGNMMIAVLFYHITLLVCITAIIRSNGVGVALKGFHRILGPAICLGGVVPGVIILYLWPYAKLDTVTMPQIFSQLHLSKQLFMYSAGYACLVNPVLEELFWRGSFQSGGLRPAKIDAAFSGFHCLAVLPVLKWPFILFIFLALTFVGWLFRVLFHRTGGLLIPLLTHFIADAAIMVSIWRVLNRSVAS